MLEFLFKIWMWLKAIVIPKTKGTFDLKILKKLSTLMEIKKDVIRQMKTNYDYGKFLADNKAEMTPKSIVTLIVGLLLIAYLAPEAISAIYNATTTGWDSGAQNIWSVLGIIVIIGFMVKIIES